MVPAFKTDLSSQFEQMLEDETYSHTGIKGKSEQPFYLKCYKMEAFDCSFISFVAHPSPQP